MKLRCALLLMAVRAFLVTSAWADEIQFKNGDRITGKIQKKDSAGLTIKSDLFGPVTVPWESVTRVTSDDPVTVVLPDGKSLQGKITVADQRLEVATPTSKETIAADQVSAIRNSDEQKAWERLQHPGLLALWKGAAGIGVSFARGNAATTTITTAMNVSRETRTDKTTAYFNQIYSKGKVTDDTLTVTAEAIRGGWAYNRNLRSRLFVNLLNDYEYDAFQSLDLRFTFGGGLGYSLVKNETTQFDLLGGADYSHEKFSTSLTRNSAEAYWGDNLTHRLTKSTSLTQTLRMFSNLSNTGEYRINFDMGATTSLKKWLSWQLTFSDRFLSDPVPGHKENDVLLTTGLRVTLAR
jgi:putative salt-induced outer membrane protein YdiY